MKPGARFVCAMAFGVFPLILAISFVFIYIDYEGCTEGPKEEVVDNETRNVYLLSVLHRQ